MGNRFFLTHKKLGRTRVFARLAPLFDLLQLYQCPGGGACADRQKLGDGVDVQAGGVVALEAVPNAAGVVRVGAALALTSSVVSPRIAFLQADYN